jgi:hypothetical protein
MNNITNTMCRLSDLSTTQVSLLRKLLPGSMCFDFHHFEPFIGFSTTGTAGTWKGTDSTTVVTYATMMELLQGKPMNTKEQAQSQYLVVQAEMERLKAIIDTPEPVVPKLVGRVLHHSDLSIDQRYYLCVASGVSVICSYSRSKIDNSRILSGLAFYDEDTATKYVEYLKLEHELRMAQALEATPRYPDGLTHYLYLRNPDELNTNSGYIHHKVHFNTSQALQQFQRKYTRQQLILLIRGV